MERQSIFGDLPFHEYSGLTKLYPFLMEETQIAQNTNACFNFGRERIDSEDIGCPVQTAPKRRKTVILDFESNCQLIERPGRNRKISMQSVEEQNFLVDFKVW